MNGRYLPWALSTGSGRQPDLKQFWSSMSGAGTLKTLRDFVGWIRRLEDVMDSVIRLARPATAHAAPGRGLANIGGSARGAALAVGLIAEERFRLRSPSLCSRIPGVSIAPRKHKTASMRGFPPTLGRDVESWDLLAERTGFEPSSS
jgi:hypothetical protein